MRINHYQAIQNNPYKSNVQDMKQGSFQSRFKRDDIQISEEAKSLLQSSQFSEERVQKVNEIKSQIDGGTYQVKITETVASVLNFWRKS
jgi:negative regulator of flagellin synthesis FlgM